jgi:glycosyltransferase involved in cell wall biosynthesis
MKIAYLVTRMDELGGAQVHVRDLCLWLKEQGHEPVVLSGWPGVVSDDLQARGVKFVEIPAMQRAIHPIQDWKAFLQTRAELKKIQPDLLTCHSSKAGLIGRFAAWSLGIPVVFTAHNWTFGKGVSKIQRPIYWAMEWIAGKFCDHIITVSEHGRKQALSGFIKASDKITAIHNGMPDRPVTTKQANELTKLIMVARVGWPKDHERLIRVLHDHCKHLSWELDLVGGGDLDKLHTQINELGLQERIHVLGERKDVPALLQSSDIFLLVSDWEGFPLSTLEAMCCGLPVIVSNAGGAAEAVVNGRTGFVIQPGSDETLAAALKTLIPDLAQQKSMGEQGRQLFEEKFTFEKMAQKTFSLYETVVAARSNG